MAKLTNLERWRREQSSGAAGPAIAKDALADLIFSLLLDREDELGLRPRLGFRGRRSWLLFERSFD
jgi:hypothetical protein